MFRKLFGGPTKSFAQFPGDCEGFFRNFRTLGLRIRKFIVLQGLNNEGCFSWLAMPIAPCSISHICHPQHIVTVMAPQLPTLTNVSQIGAREGLRLLCKARFICMPFEVYTYSPANPLATRHRRSSIKLPKQIQSSPLEAPKHSLVPKRA